MDEENRIKIARWCGYPEWIESNPFINYEHIIFDLGVGGSKSLWSRNLFTQADHFEALRSSLRYKEISWSHTRRLRYYESMEGGSEGFEEWVFLSKDFIEADETGFKHRQDEFRVGAVNYDNDEKEVWLDAVLKYIEKESSPLPSVTSESKTVKETK